MDLHGQVLDDALTAAWVTASLPAAAPCSTSGFPEPPILAVIHVVWSFTRADGLVAVHAGMLLPSGRDGTVRWLGLTRLPYEPTTDSAPGPRLLPGYQDQASSEIRLAPRPQARSDAG